ncbi:MAG: SRPBCC family protein [Bradymonadia bacterium]
MKFESNGHQFALIQEQFIPQPLDRVWDFFSNAENLERLTPGFLNFSILTPTPITMYAGTLIDYRIKLFGVPMKWRTEIKQWEPGANFVDQQLSGPYRLWHHQHTFEAVDGGTKMVDRVDYALPLGFLGRLAHVLFVKRTLARIFRYRYEAVDSIFSE